MNTRALNWLQLFGVLALSIALLLLAHSLWPECLRW